jgi:uncharacterized protein (TIGR03790 family)
MIRRSLVTGLLVVTAWLPRAALALGPDDVFIVANRNVPDSLTIAQHYCSKRGVSAERVIALDLAAGEDISRADFDAKLVGPLRDELNERRDQVKVLLTVYGVPLRVGAQEPSTDERAELETVRTQLEPLENERGKLDELIKELEAKAKDEPQAPEADELAARRKERADLEERIRPLQQRAGFLSYQESHAAVDSELALLWHAPYELRRFQLNPLYFQLPAEARNGKPPVVMTCRLDGPSVELVKRLIDQAVETEATGLAGKVYIDARGIRYDAAEGGFGYGGYDESMRETAKLLESEGKMEVTLDDRPELFAPGSCDECALYCGWYSLATYVDCCRFVPGAVAWHLASSEAVSLRDVNSTLWCKSLLEHGAAATLGPVAEPYTIGFPKPAEFFGTLATGEFTLVESYWRTALFASWMTVLVGDPLYTPFARSPKLKIERVRPSPEGTRLQATTEP